MILKIPKFSFFMSLVAPLLDRGERDSSYDETKAQDLLLGKEGFNSANLLPEKCKDLNTLYCNAITVLWWDFSACLHHHMDDFNSTAIYTVI